MQWLGSEVHPEPYKTLLSFQSLTVYAKKTPSKIDLSKREEIERRISQTYLGLIYLEIIWLWLFPQRMFDLGFTKIKKLKNQKIKNLRSGDSWFWRMSLLCTWLLSYMRCKYNSWYKLQDSATLIGRIVKETIDAV